MGTPCTLDPLGSGNSSPYQKGEVLIEIAAPPEVSSNGNLGASSGSCCAASVYGGYGTQNTTGYGKLQYIGSK